MRVSVGIGDVWAEIEDDAPYDRAHAQEMLTVCSGEVITDYEATLTIGEPRAEDAK